LQAEISRPSCDHFGKQRLKLTTAALVDKLLEEVTDAPEPIDRVAGATRAVAAAPTASAGAVGRAVLAANPHDCGGGGLADGLLVVFGLKNRS
jgi:hypothetical protein